MPAFHVSKTIRIQASPEKVYSIISDFHHWPAWSPWLIAEPGAKVEIQTDGKAYSWQGKRTGSGDMKVNKENAPTRLDMVVRFLKPWKSTSPVWFELKQQGQETDVTWHMDGSLPFFLFFMTRTMTAYIGMDYQRGLLMLKDYVETGAVPSQLKFDGIRSYAGCTYVGIKAACSMETVGQKMADDFGKLSGWVSQNSQYPGRSGIFHLSHLGCGEEPCGLHCGVSGEGSAERFAHRVYQRQNSGDESKRHCSYGFV